MLADQVGDGTLGRTSDSPEVLACCQEGFEYGIEGCPTANLDIL
jgi:hypothetical protein